MTTEQMRAYAEQRGGPNYSPPVEYRWRAELPSGMYSTIIYEIDISFMAHVPPLSLCDASGNGRHQTIERGLTFSSSPGDSQTKWFKQCKFCYKIISEMN